MHSGVEPGISPPHETAEVDEIVGRLGKTAASITTAIKRSRKTSTATPDAFRTAKMLQEIREHLESLVALHAKLKALEETWNSRAELQFLELEADLRDACIRRGWQVDGQWPTLYIERGVAVEIDEKKRTVIVGGRRAESPGTAEIVSALELQVRELFPKAFATRTFITALATAYDEARGASTQVPIFEVYRHLVMRSQRPRFWHDAQTNGFLGIGVDQFRARLARTLDEGPTAAPDGRELRLLPPLNPKDGLFLYLPAEARFGYVGRIEFIRANCAEDV